MPCFAQKEIQLAVQTGHSSSIGYLSFSNNGALLASAGSDNIVVVWDVSKRKQIQTLSGHSSTVTSVAFHPTQELVATVSNDGQAYIRNLTDGQIIWAKRFSPHQIGLTFNQSGNELLVAGHTLSKHNWEKENSVDYPINNLKYVRYNTDFSRFVAVQTNGNVIVGDVSTMSEIQHYKGNFERAVYSDDNQFLYAAGKNGILKKWNLNGGNLWKGMTITTSRFWDSFYDVAVNDNYFVGANKNKMIYVRNHRSGKLEHILKAHKQEVKSLAISPTGKLLASAGGDRKILLWSIEDGDLIGELKGVSNRINDVMFGESGQSLVMAYDGGGLKISSLNTTMTSQTTPLPRSLWDRIRKHEVSAQEIKKFDEQNSVSFVAVKKMQRIIKRSSSNNHKYKMTDGIWDLNNNTIALSNWEKISQYPEKIKLHEYPSGSVTTSMDTININGQTLVTNHSDKITAIAKNPRYDYFATASWDGVIKIWDQNTLNLQLNYSAMDQSDYIITDPSGYYYATKGALRGVGFFVKGQILAFDQFDTKFNRPDFVFSKLPYIEPTIIHNYKLAYEKRLSKLNLDVNDLDFDQEIPEIHFKKEEVRYVTKTRDYKIGILGHVAKSPFSRLHVLLNGVPLYGIHGKEVHGKTIDSQLNLKLNPGKNEVTLFASNEKGGTSYHEIIHVNCQAKEIKPTLYLVTIGASEFQMEEYNLTYAAKDAKDITASFQKNNYYKEVKTLSLINEQVNLGSLTTIEAFIAQANTEDVVMMFMAGHGVLSNQFDYYLSTHDMDFNNPSKKGISYDALERLFEKTASRNKTMILDACHSGEVDKEELEINSQMAILNEGVTFRSVGTQVEYANKTGLKSSFELSQQLFADMRSNNGTTVISSAGGAEYAFEGKEWSNGLFTYVLLDGLKSKKADLNNDGKIMLSELQKHLIQEVPRLSGGLQTPTSRVENLNNDFRIK